MSGILNSVDAADDELAGLSLRWETAQVTKGVSAINVEADLANRLRHFSLTPTPAENSYFNEAFWGDEPSPLSGADDSTGVVSPTSLPAIELAEPRFQFDSNHPPVVATVVAKTSLALAGAGPQKRIQPSLDRGDSLSPLSLSAPAIELEAGGAKLKAGAVRRKLSHSPRPPAPMPKSANNSGDAPLPPPSLSLGFKNPLVLADRFVQAEALPAPKPRSPQRLPAVRPKPLSSDQALLEATSTPWWQNLEEDSGSLDGFSGDAGLDPLFFVGVSTAF